MTSEIQAALKVRYGGFIRPLPSHNTIAKDAPFVSQEMKSGRSYNFPVHLKLPHGVTFDDTHTAFDLNDALSPGMEEASLTGASILVRDTVAYDDVFATRNGIANGGGAGGAYMSAWDYKTMGLMQSGELYRELQLMFGPGATSTAAANIGVISSSVSGADLSAGQVVNLTRASWIPGLWPLMSGAKVDVYQTDGATLRAADVLVSNPVEATNRITLTKSGSGVTVAATDIIIPNGALDVSCAGLQAIAENTGSLFGISAATYPQWKVATHSCGSAAIERLDVLSIGAKQKDRGVTNGGKLYASTRAFTDLAEEAAELKRFGSDSGVTRQGSTSLVYDTACGPIEVISYSFMKQANALFLPSGITKRVGSTDLTFSDGKSDEWFLQQLSSKAGMEMRIFTNQAIVIEQPWHAVWVTAISSTADTSPA